jgi:drug/metabolite transporter (DMT)-like permease
VSDILVDRRARTPRQELWGSVLSALMALQFAAVVMFGKQVAAGDLPFPMLAIRFAGQSLLLFLVLLVLRRPLAPARGERLPLVLASTVGYGTEAALFFSALNHGKAGAVTLLFYTYPVWVMLATIVCSTGSRSGATAVELKTPMQATEGSTSTGPKGPAVWSG